MIGELLPSAVVAVEAYDDAAEAELFPEEAVRVAAAGRARRREFGTTRGCARTALAKLGVDPVPIPTGARGAPVWPPGVVGSMTHCAGYRAATVARDRRVAALGVDAEPNLPLPDDGMLALISLPEERAHLAELVRLRPGVSWERLLFSAKESVYKTWFPLVGRWLEFEEAEVTVDPDAGSFHARLLVPGPVVDGVRVDGFHGRWTVRRGLIVTAIALTRPGGPR